MALRDNVFEKFGPILLEALFDQTLDILNDLRSRNGLPAITKEAFLGSTNNHLHHLEPYNWMDVTNEVLNP